MAHYDKDKIKNSLTIEQIFDLVAELGGEPIMQNGFFVSQTICHNEPGEGSHKLYYYDNTKLFRCYTECNDTFDIFQLVMKVKHIELYPAIIFVASYFNFPILAEDFDNSQFSLHDWQILNNYEKNNQVQQEQIVEMRTFDSKILQHLPRPRIPEWEQEGITWEVMQHRGIAYDPKNDGIVIPHYDIDGNLIGVRERTLIKEEEKNGKYKPAKLNQQLYNHPLSFNLYNLNNSKDSIKIIKKAIIFEGEKSCLKYASYFGEDNDISVAVCGSSLIRHQVQLLLSLGVEEIIIAFDKQFKELNDEEHKKWCKKLTEIYNKYNNMVQISYMFDKEKLLGYKDSPIDAGPNIFIQLFKERIYL